jgi:hypothetical protein
MPRFFSENYWEARTRFLEACKTWGATTNSHRQENTPEHMPVDLTVDTARVGPTNATRTLLLISATHGVEGFCGSACQLAFAMSESCNRIRADTSVFFIHALNPFGFAALRRVDAENIDLNRNFVEDFRTLADYNPEYAILNSALNPTQWREVGPQDGDQEIYDFIKSRGTQKFQEVVSVGQYRYPKGLFFGGSRKAWSRLILEHIAKTEFKQTRSLCIVDYHSGLGAHGVGELISFAPEGSDEYRRSAQWFGPEVKSTKSKTVETKSVSANVGGPIDSAFRDGEKTVTFLALEFGTIPVPAVLRALRAENWLTHYGNLDSSAETWQNMVIDRSKSVLQKAMAGLVSS